MKNNNERQEWFVVINPVAGGGKVGKKWLAIQTQFQSAGIDFLFEKTTRKGQATEITKKAIENGFRKIIAVGGDGTGNEVANGILDQNIVESSKITFALLPVGTGNDWIKTHGIPKNMDAWIQCLKNENTLLQDVGRVDCFRNDKKVFRYFINVAGLAYDAFAVQQSENKPHYIFPKIQYLLLILRCLFKYKLKKARLIFDDQIVEDYFYTINTGICKYSGGGMQLVPHADPTDGLLALTYAGKLSKLEVILNTYRFYVGNLLEHPKISGCQTQKIRVEALEEEPTGVEVDGEFVGHTPVEITILPKALKIVKS